MALQDYDVRPINSTVGKEFIREHHYTHGVHNGPMCYGLFDGGNALVGVIAFATPSSENVCASVFGSEFKRSVTELHRLVILDSAPKNGESFLIARALKMLHRDRPKYVAVLSFADWTEGHLGIIYQATNAIYTGTSARATFYRDDAGRLRHPRQNGVNITKKMALDRGWEPVARDGKHRYLYLLPTGKAERRLWSSRLLLKSLEYPKA